MSTTARYAAAILVAALSGCGGTRPLPTGRDGGNAQDVGIPDVVAQRDDGLAETDHPDSDGQVAFDGGSGIRPQEYDILFVIDNSPSMSGKQQQASATISSGSGCAENRAGRPAEPPHRCRYRRPGPAADGFLQTGRRSRRSSTSSPVWHRERRAFHLVRTRAPRTILLLGPYFAQPTPAGSLEAEHAQADRQQREHKTLKELRTGTLQFHLQPRMTCMLCAAIQHREESATCTSFGH
jgi:hypothetical protein